MLSWKNAEQLPFLATISVYTAEILPVTKFANTYGHGGDGKKNLSQAEIVAVREQAGADVAAARAQAEVDLSVRIYEFRLWFSANDSISPSWLGSGEL